MTYKELQAAVKGFKAQGLTTIKLNSKQEVLQVEYDRLTAVVELNGQCSELSCEVILSCNTALACELPLVAPKSKPVLKTTPGKVNAQAVSEAKRVASQAPRHRTPVKDKYVVNRQVDEVRQQAIKGSSKKVSCQFSKTPKSEFFIDVNHRRYTDKLSTTEKQALDNIKSFVNAVKNIAIGFSQRQQERNAA